MAKASTTAPATLVEFTRDDDRQMHMLPGRGTGRGIAAGSALQRDADVNAGSESRLSPEDSELLKMAHFKLTDCAGRLSTLATTAQSPLLRQQLESIAHVIARDAESLFDDAESTAGDLR